MFYSQNFRFNIHHNNLLCSNHVKFNNYFDITLIRLLKIPFLSSYTNGQQNFVSKLAFIPLCLGGHCSLTVFSLMSSLCLGSRWTAVVPPPATSSTTRSELHQLQLQDLHQQLKNKLLDLMQVQDQDLPQDLDLVQVQDLHLLQE